MRDAGITPIVPEGAYYVLADISALGYPDDRAAVTSMIERIRVAAVPGSAFFSSPDAKNYLRFCFAFRDEGLREAGRRLRDFSTPTP